jgi:GNAT superfamily N-acetyltransferase
MKPGTRFRKCSSDDIPVLAEMIREMAAFLKMQDIVNAVGDKFEPQLKEHLFGQSPRAEVRIAEVDGYPAGYCAFYMTFSTFRAAPSLYLEDIYVRLPFQASGLGRHMIQAVCKIARKRGCARVEWVAPENDVRVNKFYESLEVPSVTGWKIYRARNTIIELADAAPFDDEEAE